MLQQLLENRFFAKAEKREFHAKTVIFLGFTIQEEQICSDPAKVKAVLEWPVPVPSLGSNSNGSWASLFSTNGSLRITLRSQLTSTLHKLIWTPETDQTFTHPKTLSSTAPMLSHSDPSPQFIVEVDASDCGVGAILSQGQSRDDKLHPCAFFCTLSLTSRELLCWKLNF